MKKTIISDMTEGIDSAGIALGGKILREGGLVAFPTETVYGLGGNALDAEAARKIYEAKGRPSDNPLIVHICTPEALEKITAEVPETAKRLADAFWPGPMTMIFRKSELVPESTTGGLDTVAVRFPDHPVALALIREAGGYVAAPSANTSGRPSPTLASHVWDDLHGRIDMIIDGGEVGIGIESTIVDLTGPEPVILRPGYITQEMLEKVVGRVSLDRALDSDDPAVRPKAPGMKYKHYAPKAPLYIVEGGQGAVQETIASLAEKAASEGKKVGVICTDESAENYRTGIVRSAGTRTDEATVAAHLYRILREMDALGADVIYAEAFDTAGIGMAVMNRLMKAAGHKVIHAGEEAQA